MGKTTIAGTCFVQQAAIDGDALIAPNICRHHGQVLVYAYPGGGEPTGKT